jgi:hypothetical protein
MKFSLKILSISLLLMIGTINAFARSGGYQDLRNEMHAIQYQYGGHSQGGQQGGERRSKDGSEYDGNGRGSSGAGNEANSGSDQGRKSGRMTPEERRTLRQQINEAGHDIYAPRR